MRPDEDKHTQRVAARQSGGVLYPTSYTWFVFLAALDILLTYLIMHPMVFSVDNDGIIPRGVEVNALANEVIERWGVPGMAVFKFALVVLVIGVCELIGRRRDAAGRRLAEWAVAITAIPVVVAAVQIGVDLFLWLRPIM